MADTETLLDTLAGFARNLTSEYSIDDVLLELAERVTAALGLVGAGVALSRDDRVTFASASCESIAELERAQEDEQRGPCVEAIKASRIITITDVTAPEIRVRWPAYVAIAERSGVRAVAGMPMLSGGTAIGAMNLYAHASRRWTDGDLQAARVFTDIATSYLMHASRLSEQRRTAQQLQHALDSRVIIEQAKGIIAAKSGTTVEDAFIRLRKYARDHNALIRDVASAVVNLDLRI